MSGGPRPPVPGLIPLAALSRRPGRPRRRTEPIDERVGSRCTEARASAAPGRRRHRRRRASCKQSRSSSPALDRPPRVNPIFVWVRQENTRIVDVKCEDYDKRNRILLTKTAHGWRAIPRTEMLAVPRASAEEPPLDADPTDATPPAHHHHRHHHKRKSKKIKSQHSTSVQFPDSEPVSEPSWVTSESVNIESLLPSHTIQIKRIPSSEDLENSVNIASEQEFARRTPECSTPDKVCDVTPLDNLLAVAELELKQHMQSGNWNTDPEIGVESDQHKSNITHDLQEELTTNSEEKSEECSYNDDDEMSMNDILSRLEQSLQSPHGFGSESAFDDEEDDAACKFGHFEDEREDEEDEEEGAISKQEEGCKTHNEDCQEVKEEPTSANSEPTETENTPEINQHPESEELAYKVEPPEEVEPPNDLPVSEELEPQRQEQTEETKSENVNSEETHTENEVAEAEPSTPILPSPSDEGICLDLSLKTKPPPKEDQDSGPTDLCIRKRDLSPKMQPPRPASQNSEAIQSPQPSGIPAVPASPDIVTTTTVAKPRSIFLESLLANKSAALAPEALNKSKEPLDLGQQCRKSASPTVTCSQEVVAPSSDEEPPAKKLKANDDITLKNLLDKDVSELLLEQQSKKPTDKAILQDTPRLLSLLNASSDTEDPLVEFKQLLLEIDIPNPLMVPKDVFPDLLKHPRREILKILSGHSSKNVPLDDILVVYKDKLLAAIKSSLHCKKNDMLSEKSLHNKQPANKHSEMNNNHDSSSHNANSSINNKRKISPEVHNKPPPDSNKTNLANDIDAANEAAFNPLFWSGFPNPFEALNNYSNQNELLQALYAASSVPYMHNQLSELHPSLQMMLGNKLTSPLGFPPLPPLGFNNPIELSMWQEAMMQASLLKSNSNVPQRPAAPPQKKIHHPHQSNKFTSSSTAKASAMIHPPFNNSGQSSWQNPYLGLGAFPPGNTNNLSVDTQFNPFSHKNNISPSGRHNHQQLSPSVMQKKNKEVFSQYGEQEKRLHQHMMQEHQKMQQMQQQKMLRQHHQQLYQQQLMMQSSGSMGKKAQTMGSYGFLSQEAPKQGEALKQGIVSSPIDLSGVQSVPGRPKTTGTKSNGLVTSSRSLVEDVPEVGSTTEDNMQDGHAQLWHPLFGSQNKGYSSWPLSSLTAMGE